MAEVVLDRVDKVYPNGVQAIFELSLRVEDGEFLVLVGPSGCGKSTALGAEVLVHFQLDAPAAVTGDPDAAAELGGTSTGVARVNPRTMIKLGDDFELAVDTTRLHFFDPSSGERMR